MLPALRRSQFRAWIGQNHLTPPTAGVPDCWDGRVLRRVGEHHRLVRRIGFALGLPGLGLVHQHEFRGGVIAAQAADVLEHVDKNCPISTTSSHPLPWAWLIHGREDPASKQSPCELVALIYLSARGRSKTMRKNPRPDALKRASNWTSTSSASPRSSVTSSGPSGSTCVQS